jgi:hypothetical protein
LYTLKSKEEKKINEGVLTKEDKYLPYCVAKWNGVPWLGWQDGFLVRFVVKCFTGHERNWVG